MDSCECGGILTFLGQQGDKLVYACPHGHRYNVSAQTEQTIGKKREKKESLPPWELRDIQRAASSAKLGAVYKAPKDKWPSSPRTAERNPGTRRPMYKCDGPKRSVK